MTEWEGTVSSVDSRDWHGVQLWSFRLEGKDRIFRCGKEKPDVAKGSDITFTERNNQVEAGSIIVKGAVPPEIPLGAEPLQTSASVAPSRSDVNARIQRQQARRDATNLIVAALHCDALPWAANTAKGKRLDLLHEYINQVTERFLEEENGVSTAEGS